MGQGPQGGRQQYSPGQHRPQQQPYGQKPRFVTVEQYDALKRRVDDLEMDVKLLKQALMSQK